MERFGLSENAIAQIKAVLSGYPAIERAVIYGSRAKGNHKPGSDIDLTLIGQRITAAELLALENRLDDLLLPYTFDISRFETLQNTQLIDHINRIGQDFYTSCPYAGKASP
jgi:predicted nucleotidyltransferase